MTVIQKRVTVYVCPHPDCSNYYASANLQVPLSDSANRRTHMQNSADEPSKNWGKIISHRDDCPDCRIAGRKLADGQPVKRQPLDVAVNISGIEVMEPLPHGSV